MIAKAKLNFILGLVLGTVLSVPSLALAEYSSDQFLNFNQYQNTLESIEATEDDSTVGQVISYLKKNRHQNPQISLSQLGNQKIKSWTQRFIFGEEISEGAPGDTHNETAPAEALSVKVHINPLKESARVGFDGPVEGQIDFSSDKYAVSLNLFQASERDLSLKYLYQQDELGLKNQLHFQLNF